VVFSKHFLMSRFDVFLMSFLMCFVFRVTLCCQTLSFSFLISLSITFNWFSLNISSVHALRLFFSDISASQNDVKQSV
jgi:hypothetical protein